jgi:DNA-binding transcriptional MerR regulator
MSDFMKAYSIKEVSSMIDIPEGTLRQWEKDFAQLLVIPRDKQNARYYTDFEIETLKHIKAMRAKNLSKDMIRELLQKRAETGSDTAPIIEPSVSKMSQNEAIETLRNIQSTFESFEDFKLAMKEELVSELRNEIRQEVKNELISEVRKEIASSSEQHQKLLETGKEQTSEQIGILSESLEKMENNYQSEIKRRDDMLMENMRLLRELKEEQNKGFFKKLFGGK